MNEADTKACEPVDNAESVSAQVCKTPIKRAVMLTVFGLILVALVGAFYLALSRTRAAASPLAMLAGSGKGNSESGKYQRGVDSSVVKYAAKDYTKASWRLVYDISKLPNSDAAFLSFAGWDKNNLIIHGEVSYTNEGGTRLLTLRLHDGEWKASDQNTEGHYAFYKALWLDKHRYLFYYQGRGPFPGNLVVYNNEKPEVLSTIPVPYPVKSIYLTDRDSIYLTARAGGKAFLYTVYKPLQRVEMVDEAESGVVMNDSKSQMVQACKQTFYYSTSDLSSFDAAGAVRFVTPFKTGSAAGLIQEGAYDSPACGLHKTPLMLVEFRDGKWHLNQLFTDPQADVEAAWFKDQSTCVTAGKSEINIIKDGKITHKKILVGSDDYTDQHFSAVWGTDMDNFYAMNTVGDVFHYFDGAWNREVKGPDIKHEAIWNQSVTAPDVFEQVNNKYSFDKVWVSPDGAVFGMRRKTIYMLD